MPLDPKANRGWHHRGYLPHYDSTHVIQSLTFRLADALPKARLDAWDRKLRAIPEERRDIERRKWIEAWQDAGHGCCVLRRPEAAEMVRDALYFFDGERYTIHAWVIMPNHVHWMIQPLPGHSLSRIMQSIKAHTAKLLLPMMPANALTGRERRAWQPSYWDRYIRNGEHYARAVRYIERNPVEAGFVARARDWRWSSAYGREAPEERWG